MVTIGHFDNRPGLARRQHFRKANLLVLILTVDSECGKHIQRSHQFNACLPHCVVLGEFLEHTTLNVFQDVIAFCFGVHHGLEKLLGFGGCEATHRFGAFALTLQTVSAVGFFRVAFGYFQFIALFVVANVLDATAEMFLLCC